MSKITRKTQKVFAENAGSTGITEYASPASGTPLYTVDPDDIQTAGWQTGWSAAALAGTEIPTFQDFNAIHYVSTRQLGYLFQEGIPEYDTGTEYHQNSLVKKSGTYEIYGSKTNGNQGNALTDTTNWELLIDFSEEADSVAIPIGSPFPVWDNLTGVSAPDNSGDAKYIKLTAGETGVGAYNEGLLAAESVTGSAPLVTATANIDLTASPLDGETVHLINTEEAFLRAKETSGVKQNDQMQKITGSTYDSVQHQNTLSNLNGISGVFSYTETAGGNSSGGATAGTYTFNSENSPNARTSSSTNGETRSKNVSATFYMRIL